MDLNDQRHIRERTQQDRAYDPDTYDVSDLGVATAIASHGIMPVRLRRLDFKRVAFEFPDTDQVREIEAAFYRKDCKVDAFTFCDMGRMLKYRLHDV